MIPNLLSIAGSDPSGGAGIQADLKTFSALGGYGMAVITALTVQNTQGVRSVQNVQHPFVGMQVEALLDDSRIDAIKIGMAGSPDAIGVISEILRRYKCKNIVLDTVMVAQSGDSLLSDDSVQAMRRELVPVASVITPNIPEAEILLNKKLKDDFNYNLEDMAVALLELGAPAIFLKGGHGGGKNSVDVFVDKSGRVDAFEAPRVATINNHGTGCTLSSAIAVYVAKGLELSEACRIAKKYVTNALYEADALKIGKGHGPVHHFHALW